jgi:hypothetical protein
MKKIIMIMALALVSSIGFAQKLENGSAVGFNMGYGFADSDNPIAGLDFRYCIIDDVRISASLNHLIKNNSLSAWRIGLDGHYLLPLTEKTSFYPLAGVNLNFFDSAGKSITRLGANIGFGAELYVNYNITVGTELKYQVVKDYEQTVLAVRVGYSF